MTVIATGTGQAEDLAYHLLAHTASLARGRTNLGTPGSPPSIPTAGVGEMQGSPGDIVTVGCVGTVVSTVFGELLEGSSWRTTPSEAFASLVAELRDAERGMEAVFRLQVGERWRRKQKGRQPSYPTSGSTAQRRQRRAATL
ncbi:hypothetical protein CKAH01_07846 [Colletotrichum kahawae]|uniref:Uncharacterized protein n=1 Tax=Colletotrichum kahawae TaxID=34407 RepID=A0AAD9Y4L9_COLKA|nr:hypothetical protein CKAH01_07846 [Colletotrichum kahawae]